MSHACVISPGTYLLMSCVMHSVFPSNLICLISEFQCLLLSVHIVWNWIKFCKFRSCIKTHSERSGNSLKSYIKSVQLINILTQVHTCTRTCSICYDSRLLFNASFSFDLTHFWNVLITNWILNVWCKKANTIAQLQLTRTAMAVNSIKWYEMRKVFVCQPFNIN